MNFFKSLFDKKQHGFKEEFEYELLPRNEEGYFVDDFLGLAANEGTKATKAINEEKFDDAWRHYQKMNQLYIQHAKKEKFTMPQTLALVGSTHRAMARLLKAENRHHEALVHILYCTACSNDSLENELKQYRPYFNRCKYTNIQLEEVSAALSVWRENPDFLSIRGAVAEWKARDGNRRG